MSGSAADHLGWLREQGCDPLDSGLDPSGWADSTWVLHGIFEDPTVGKWSRSPNREALDDLARPLGRKWRRRLRRQQKRGMFISTNTSMAQPAPDSARIRWRDIATDAEQESWTSAAVPPSFSWFARREWPARTGHPSEGTMDGPTLDRLIEVIAAWSGNSGSDDCLAFYSPLATGEFDDVPFVVETRMDAIKQLVDAEAGRSGTPTNWWPADRSWFVYTDWDLWATKVSGPAQLVRLIRNDDWLESIDWVRPAIGDGGDDRS